MQQVRDLLGSYRDDPRLVAVPDKTAVALVDLISPAALEEYRWPCGSFFGTAEGHILLPDGHHEPEVTQLQFRDAQTGERWTEDVRRYAVPTDER